MPVPDIVLLTDHRFVKLDPRDPFHQNLEMEEGSLMEALRSLGWKVERRSWDDPDFDWELPGALLFRSTWDYMDRITEFRSWLEQVPPHTRLINPLALVQWNMDKHYLQDLAHDGIPIPPTRVMEAGESGDLEKHLSDCSWEEIILKPLVSAGARHTYRFYPDDAPRYQNIFRQLIAKEAMMLQEFQPGIARHGEVSLIFLGGAYSHAVLKKAAPGDFRVQDDHGGSVAPYQAREEEVALGAQALALCRPTPLYARVDLVQGRDQRPLLMELELIEPELWFRLFPEAAPRMAEFISLHLRHDSTSAV